MNVAYIIKLSVSQIKTFFISLGSVLIIVVLFELKLKIKSENNNL